MLKEKEITIIEKDYLNDLKQIKETIRTNQNKAMVVVNSAMIMTYYEIGSIIHQRKQWGNKYIERLSKDLKEYGKGYSKRTLYYINRFYEEFTKDEIMQHPVAQISWRSIILIMSKCKDHNKALWYIEETFKNGWSRSMVLNQFKLNAYERSLINPIKTEVVEKSDDLLNESRNSKECDFFIFYQRKKYLID